MSTHCSVARRVDRERACAVRAAASITAASK
jgi:hypothetical protein